MVAVMTKTLTLGFALIALMPLATVSGLQCCNCAYKEGMPDECNCNSNSVKKDCTMKDRSGLETSQADFSAALFGEENRDYGTKACAYAKGYKNGKMELMRYLGELNEIKYIRATCQIESRPDSHGYTGLEFCMCDTDWCNCGGGDGGGGGGGDDGGDDGGAGGGGGGGAGGSGGGGGGYPRGSGQRIKSTVMMMFAASLFNLILEATQFSAGDY